MIGQEYLPSIGPILIAAVTIICGWFGTRWIFQFDNDDGPKYPPSPPGKHRILGDAMQMQPQLYGLREGVAHEVIFFEILKKMKRKVITVQLPLMPRFIVVGDVAVARYILRAKTKDANGKSKALFPKGPGYQKIFPLIGRSSIVWLDGEQWLEQRRLYNPGFSPNHLKEMVSVIEQKCERFLRTCEKEDIDRDEPTNLRTRTIDLTTDVIAQVAFGEDWGGGTSDLSSDDGSEKAIQARKDGAETTEIISEFLPLIRDRMRNPLHRFLFLQEYKVWKLSRRLDDCMRRLVNRRLDEMQQTNDAKNADGPKDILGLTLSNYSDTSKSGHRLSARDMEFITSQLKTFYFAGHDTTAITISWAYWMLIQNPEKVKRAREEVSAIFGEEWVESIRNGKTLENGVTYDDIQNLEYIDCIIRESLRLYPPAATGRYSCEADAQYENVKYGKSVIVMNFYAIHRDPDFWGSDAGEFVPERFLGEEGRKKAQSDHFLGFSGGPRDCIGKYFAMLEMKIVLASMITRFDGVALDLEDEIYHSKLTSGPLIGCRVKLSRRE